ncbi:MAG TPA: hypothetical protein VNI52_04880 [Sphingobacteriaceae bacterium]|nr:hypothetical protein [Sphingobacteriaceae bacterium]
MESTNFHTTQLLKVSLEKAWAFFTSPANLAIITPSDMGFKIYID